MMYKLWDKSLYGDIVLLVNERPEGIPLYEAAERLGRPSYTLRYQINNAEKLGLIRVRRGRAFTLLYPATK